MANDSARMIRPASVRGGALAVLYGFTAVSLLGYATFGRHPGWLAAVPALSEYYGTAFRLFSLGHVWLAWAAFVLVHAAHAGGRWLAPFAALYGVSLASELAGTGWGVPFGAYRYSKLLEPMWFGRVPVAIPLSWYVMAASSYVLARAAVPDRPAVRVVLASLVLLAWDLALDPAMSRATAFWSWAVQGPYYGMPLVNLLGWFATGLVLAVILEAWRAERWLATVPVRWYAGFYGANLLLPLGMNAAAGLWGAVAAPVGVLGLLVVAARWAGRRRVGGPVAVEVMS